MISALWFWKSNNINKYADKDDVEGVTRRINGGTTGLVRRMVLTDEWKTKIV
jgi:putative chitinase